MCSKANLLTPSCGEGKCKVLSKQHGQLILKRWELPDGFQPRVFKDNISDEGRRVHDQLMHVFLIGWW